MKWGINNIDNSCHHINIPNPDITIYTDASLTGWSITDCIFPSRALWHKAELGHINFLELKAIEIEICTYCKNKGFLHVRVMCDNATAISYGNSMWDMKSQTFNNFACRIWGFVLKTSCGFQQHIYQEQSILRQIISLVYWRMLLSGNRILLFFKKS